MNVLKGFGVGILSFLLFLSLSVFGLAFMLNSTLLNPDFVAAEVDKLDVSTLARELTKEQVGKQLPEEMSFLKEAIYDVIEDHEPWLKEQVNVAIYSGYDFFLGKSEHLDMTISLAPLKESLRDSLWQAFKEQPPSELLGMAEDQLKPYLEQHFHEFAEMIPEEYLPPEIAGLPEDQLKLYLEQNYEKFAELIPIESLPPEIFELLEDQLKPYFDQYYQEFAQQIPDEFKFNESLIPPEAMEQMILARQYIGYFQTVYKALIGFMVLLVLGIFLINRDVRNTTRSLGITFLIYGAIFIFVVKYLVPTYLFPFLSVFLSLPVIPSSLQACLIGLFSDILAPLQTFSLGLLIGGVVLLVVSFVYKPRLVED